MPGVNPGRYRARLAIYEIAESGTEDGVAETTTLVRETWGRFVPLSIEASSRLLRGIGNARVRPEAKLYFRKSEADALGVLDRSRRFSVDVDGTRYEIGEARPRGERSREVVALLQTPLTP